LHIDTHDRAYLHGYAFETSQIFRVPYKNHLFFKVKKRLFHRELLTKQ
jgi:hypothetical protein